MLTKKENYMRFLRREKCEWIPCLGDFQIFSPRIVPDNKARAFSVEVDPVPPAQWGGEDMFGVEWEYIPVAGGSMEKEGVPHLMDDVNDWKDVITFPDVDSWPWEEAAERNKNFIDRTKFVQVWFFTGFFERLISFMGFEDAAVAMIDEDQEDAIHELFDALADTYIKIIANYKKYFDIDGVYMHDDWGTQKSTFFSRSVAMDMIAPHMKKVSDYCHANGLVYESHSCGKNESIIDAYLAAGSDQWIGQDMNDVVKLRREYGDKIVVGYNFVHGTHEEIKAQFDKMAEEVREDFVAKPAFISIVRWPQEDQEYLRDLGREFMASL